MRAVFLGTPDVAAVALRALLDSTHEVVAVVTQPDRPRGRSGASQPPPAKEVALEAGLPVLQPENPKDPTFAEELKQFAPDVLAVVAYGHILARHVLEVAPAVNAHFSLLPKYRGAAPVARAVQAGEKVTGVTTFLLEPAVDAGPILLQEETPIGDDETAGELLARLAPIAARLLVESLIGLEANTLQPRTQDPSGASPAPKVKPEEAEIDWSKQSEHIRNDVRAFNPSPGAWTTLEDGKRLKIWRSRAYGAAVDGEPGSFGDGPAFVVACGSGALELLEIQPEGKRRMGGEEFLRGLRPGIRRRLGHTA
jgi:methionyl-tRNA formyltransferase